MKTSNRVHRIISVIGWLLIIGIVAFILSGKAIAQTTSKNISKQSDNIIYGVITYVFDGETFLFQSPNGQKMKIRLQGIDTPESNQPYGSLATAFIHKLINGKKVEINVTHTLRSGLLIGTVYIINDYMPDNKLNVSEELLKNGLAWYDKRQALNQHFADLEKHARIMHIGLWADMAPIAPWKWHKTR